MVDENYNIETVKGDWLPLTITPLNEDKTPYIFKEGDVIRFRVIKKKDPNCVLLEKDFTPVVGTDSIDIDLLASDMDFGDISPKPIDYWYEVIINPNTDYELTIIGYKNKDIGAKILTLTPKGVDKV